MGAHGKTPYGCVVQPTMSGVGDPGAPQAATNAASTLVPDLFRIARRLRRFGGPAQIDVAALMLLHRLACDGPKRPSDLATDAGLDLSTVSRHIRALDEDGLIVREPDPSDGRSFHLSLTAKGGDLLVDALRRREQSVDRALTAWDVDDVATLRRLLGRLADDLDRIDEETR
jgi:DNA-binding MarR family transcriptional regulator